MRHPFQTDTFDPGDPELHKRVWAGRQAHEGFHIGSTAYLVDGVRWIYMHGTYPYPCPYKLSSDLTYPLPASYGECPHEAMNVFASHWNAERRRLWALEPPPPMQEQAAPQPSKAPAPAHRPRQRQRSAMDLHNAALAGAVPLPGLEPWTAFGRQG